MEVFVNDDLEGVQDDAQELGAPVHVVREQWTKWMKRGVIVDVTIRRARLQRKIEPRDLGLVLSKSESDALMGVMDLGHKLLMPRALLRRAQTVETRLRTIWPKIGCFRTHWGHFAPFTVWEQVKYELTDASEQITDAQLIERGEVGDQLKRIEKEYREIGKPLSVTTLYMLIPRYIVINWEALISQLKAEYTVVARQVYKDLRRKSPELLRNDEGREITPNEFARAFVARNVGLVEAMGAEYIAKTFRVEPSFYYIPLPSMLEREMEEAEKIRLRVQERIDRARHRAEMRRQKELAARTEAEIRQAQIEAMHRDVVETLRSQYESQVRDFIADMKGQVMERFYKMASNYRDYLARKGELKAAHYREMKRLVEVLEGMVFWDWPEAQKMMEKIRAEVVDTANADRDTGSITAMLDAIHTLSRAELSRLDGTTDRLGVDLEAITPPAPEDVRLARFEVGLPVVDDDALTLDPGKGRLI